MHSFHCLIDPKTDQKPRDMGLGAARQLRAHLNFVADALDADGLAGPAVPIATSNRHDVDPTRFGTQNAAQM